MAQRCYNIIGDDIMNKITKILFATVTTVLLTAGTAVATGPDWQLPIKKQTPGVLNPVVTQSNIKDNICKSGWTDTIRPPVSYTNKLKNDQLAGPYVSFTKIWGTDPSAYEEDHLISLQLGGSPTDPKNLFPEPYSGNNARKKDVVETKLKRLVCAGTITLKVAQKAISSDWAKAYQKYVVNGDTADNSSN